MLGLKYLVLLSLAPLCWARGWAGGEPRVMAGGPMLLETCARKNPIMTDDNFLQVLDYFETCYNERLNLNQGLRRRYLSALADRVKHTSERFIRQSRMSVKDLLPVYVRVKGLSERLSPLAGRVRRDSGGGGGGGGGGSGGGGGGYDSAPCEPLYLITPSISAFLTGIAVLLLLLLLGIAVIAFAWYRDPCPSCRCEYG